VAPGPRTLNITNLAPWEAALRSLRRTIATVAYSGHPFVANPIAGRTPAPRRKRSERLVLGVRGVLHRVPLAAFGLLHVGPVVRDAGELDVAGDGYRRRCRIAIVKLNTRGRWPVVGAAGLVPVSVAAVGRPGLRPLAALLWHQTEEWVWPGAFLPWINREVLGSDDDEFPIDRRLALMINVVFGWGLSVATLAGPPAAASTALLYTTHLSNTALHLTWAAQHRRYDPGSVTAVATLAPVAVAGLRQLARDPAVPLARLGAGIMGGVLMSATLIPDL
jgi:hypothetical protein